MTPGQMAAKTPSWCETAPTKVTSPPPSLPPQGLLLFRSKMETFFKQECLAEEYGLLVGLFSFFLFIWMLISLFFISEYNPITFHGKHICESVLYVCTLKYWFSKESCTLAMQRIHTHPPCCPQLYSRVQGQGFSRC